MLVLSRKLYQRIFVGDDIVLTVVEVRPDKVRIGIEAPRDVQVVRDDAIYREPRNAGRDNAL